MRTRTALVLLLVSVAVPFTRAQVLDAPAPHLPLTDKILLGTVAGGRAADAFTTRQFLLAGQEEGALPAWIACRQPQMWTYSMTLAAGQVQLSRMLIRRHHIRIARSLELIHAAYIWTTVAHNEQIIPGPKTRSEYHANPCIMAGDAR